MSRLVVVHECLDFDMVQSVLREDDTVFFDDCLYSQYRFFKDRQPQLKCREFVFGFSPKLLRPAGSEGIAAVKSADAHRECNKTIKTLADSAEHVDAIRAFMTENELKDVLKLPRTTPALHGCCHLELSKLPRFDQLTAFAKDVRDGIEEMKRLRIETDVFVYPYAFSRPEFGAYLKRLGFRRIYAAPDTKRIPVENLYNI